ncbi:hypothetical protein GPLA_3719 [Paraglaciecola polaris LMG 21857]|uniref:Uncharacterized protein n=1 Tax=Paraglaciecola polaris LMG 21857 TaxID=1129793 RepID=K6YPE8_9ALTE|nr:hypothetical protein GPLA_3719 [Paraglaciecola polaris LMG 21857]
MSEQSAKAITLFLGNKVAGLHIIDLVNNMLIITYAACQTRI